MPLRPQKPHCFKLSTPLMAATQLAKYTFGSRTQKRSGLGEGSCEPTPYRRFPLELTSMSPPGILCTPPARYHNNSIQKLEYENQNLIQDLEPRIQNQHVPTQDFEYTIGELPQQYHQETKIYKDQNQESTCAVPTRDFVYTIGEIP